MQVRHLKHCFTTAPCLIDNDANWRDAGAHVASHTRHGRHRQARAGVVWQSLRGTVHSSSSFCPPHALHSQIYAIPDKPEPPQAQPQQQADSAAGDSSTARVTAWQPTLLKLVSTFETAATEMAIHADSVFACEDGAVLVHNFQVGSLAYMH
jgi:hypothetical protein